MSAMLEFYFRFRFRPYLQNRHVILHQPAKVHRNRATHRGVMTLDRFFDKKNPMDPSLQNRARAPTIL